MKPEVILYNAVSLDMKLTGFEVDMETYYRLASHWNEDATLVGSATILADPDEIPPETDADFEPHAIDPADARALLVIPDSRGLVRIWHYLRSLPYWRDCIALVSETTPADYLDYLSKRHIRYIICGSGKVDLPAALKILNEAYKVNTIRADCGGTLNTALLSNGLVDEISYLVHPVIMGRGSTVQAIKEPLDRQINLELVSAEKMDQNLVWLRYRVVTL